MHHHPDKDETFVILKGKVRVTTYKDNGKILASCVISQESGTYGVDIPMNVWHGLECLEPSHCTGDTVFATLHQVMGDKIHAFY